MNTSAPFTCSTATAIAPCPNRRHSSLTQASTTWAGAVTTIAVGHRVDPIASQTYETPILALQVKVNRRDSQAAMNPCLFTLVTTLVVMGSDEPRTANHSYGNNRRECCDDSLGLQRPLFCVMMPLLLLVSRVSLKSGPKSLECSESF